MLATELEVLAELSFFEQGIIVKPISRERIMSICLNRITNWLI